MQQGLRQEVVLPEEVQRILATAPLVTWASSLGELFDLACGSKEGAHYRVEYTLPDGREILEATVVRVKNGISVNYPEPYMRRRDPECLVIADDKPSDKPHFEACFGKPFDLLRDETFAWLSRQELVAFAFEIGRSGLGSRAIALCPKNAAFFALSLAMLQGIVNLADQQEPFQPSTVVYVAPPFRHMAFSGRQVVVHNRVEVHEIFSYNLYPGPSAKKGIYGALIEQGTEEGWVTAHCSAVRVITPYDNVVTFMHEGASGSGKSEMLQQPHRLSDGRILIGRNTVTGEERYLEIPRTCDLHPVCDDMGLCHPEYQERDGKLWLMDAEDAWFVRVNHIERYGTDHDLEGLTVAPLAPLLFFNIDAVAGSTALIWEHVEDAPGRRCPNPRVILPRHIIPHVVHEKVGIDIRSFGVRTPPCTQTSPSYGILGLFHLLPPALAWLWRLVAPRGYSNPSILDTGDMGSEGVGSYWPFATGRRVDQANLLLRQLLEAPHTKYILTPNQHVGAWETGFMPQWLARDYLARRGHARFKSDQLAPARCALLGYALHTMRIEGTTIPRWFLEVETQPEIGTQGYDRGAQILTDFFHVQLETYRHPELDPLGQRIIDCCLAGGSVEDYERFSIAGER